MEGRKEGRKEGTMEDRQVGRVNKERDERVKKKGSEEGNQIIRKR